VARPLLLSRHMRKPWLLLSVCAVPAIAAADPAKQAAKELDPFFNLLPTMRDLGMDDRQIARFMRGWGISLISVIVLIGIGLVIAPLLSSMLRFVLFGVSPWDPVTFVLIVTVLAATGAIACLVPARRAARVSPLVALRGQ